MAVAEEGSTVVPFEGDNVRVGESRKDNKSEKDLKNPVMTGLYGNLGKYITGGVRGIGHIVWTQLKTK